MKHLPFLKWFVEKQLWLETVYRKKTWGDIIGEAVVHFTAQFPHAGRALSKTPYPIWAANDDLAATDPRYIFLLWYARQRVAVLFENDNASLQPYKELMIDHYNTTYQTNLPDDTIMIIWEQELHDVQPLSY